MTRDEIRERIMRDGCEGFLMRNDKKDFASRDAQEQRKPDYTGTVHAGGVRWFASAWVKTSKAGKTYLSMSVELAASQDLAPWALQREAEAAPQGGGGQVGEPVEDTGLPF